VIKAWRKAVLLHHPDKQASSQAATQPRDGADIRLINEAKWILSDSERRKQWEEGYFTSGMLSTRLTEPFI
jgi:DnaJ-class molecular chaperone